MNVKQNSDLQAILFDLDGVLYIGDNIIPGAAETVKTLQQFGHRIAGVTNTTTQPRRAIAEKLQEMGIPIPESSIYTPAALANRVIGNKKAALFVQDSLLEEFSSIRQSTTDPDYVVMGDVGGEGYPPETLRTIFEMVMEGAEVLALHKNRFWQKPDGLHLDLGVFVAAIEYATGKDAVVLGKPSTEFFHGICRELDVLPERTLMIGDDIESDIGGAQQAGLKSVLVETGKYREAFVKQTGIKADLVIPSVADLTDALSLL
ncbi:MAG: TIGR01458 family HAD-type hydrolase [Mariprofundaceae bacterium]|nr:TIGR01458 family HAD-type hydrolase [Mariprofundaceae bacterium]